MRKTLRLIIIVTLFFQVSLTAKAQSALPPLTDSINSTILNETRGIQVKFPADYKEGSGKKYEIVYVLDGEWYHELVPYTYNFAQSANYIPQSIFVMIRNRYLDGRNLRDRDFSPTKEDYDSITGGADKFYDFVTKEVVPYIEKKYPSNGQRSLVGSSFSGLFSVYAFLKNPAFFQSFVASDPSLSWGNNYVTQIASKTLGALPPDPGTLYIAGLTHSNAGMGIAAFDSVLKAHAPKSLHWKVLIYPDESHYSVQLKAFYDAFRFSHFGFSLTPPEYHPMSGIINNDRPFNVFFISDNPTARFTTDGSAPDTSSKRIVPNESIIITAPTQLRVKTFAFRKEDVKDFSSSYARGKLNSVTTKKTRSGLKYILYRGSFDSIPSTISLQPSKSGVVDSLFKLASVIGNDPSMIVVEGTLDVPKEAEYIFYANGYDAVELTVSGKSLFKVSNSTGNRAHSSVASLNSGTYPFRLVIVKKLSEPQPNFVIFQSKPDNAKWWENPWKQF